MKKFDMSEAAILRRLKTVDQLRTLCLSLMRAKKRIGRKEEKESADQRRKISMSENISIVWRRFEAISAGHEFACVFSEGLRHILEGTATFVEEKTFCRLD